MQSSDDEIAHTEENLKPVSKKSSSSKHKSKSKSKHKPKSKDKEKTDTESDTDKPVKKQKEGASNEILLSNLLFFSSVIVQLELTSTHLRWFIPKNPKKERIIELKNVLGVTCSPTGHRSSSAEKFLFFTVHTFPYVDKRDPTKFHKGHPIREWRRFRFHCKSDKHKIEWVKAVRKIIRQPPAGTGYTGDRRRSLLILINPFSGGHKAEGVWKQVRPMFTIASDYLKITEKKTTHRGHAYEIAKALKYSAFDGIITVSGDGLLFEVMNGMLHHEKSWKKMIQTPVGVIPGGTGNGLAMSIGCTHPISAVFAIIKGHTRPLDIFSVLQKNQPRRYGFLQTSWGFVSDVDFDSESYRWMGASRYFLTGVAKILFSLRQYQGRIKYINAEFDEENGQICTPDCRICETHHDDDHSDEDSDEEGPVLKYISKKALKRRKDEWEEEEGTDWQFVLASNVSAISGSDIFAPYAHISDGCLDLLWTKGLGKTTFAKIMIHTDDGSFVHKSDAYVYRKVKALIIEPEYCSKPRKQEDEDEFIELGHMGLPKEKRPVKVGAVGIDGECIPTQPIMIEIHPGLATLFHPID